MKGWAEAVVAFLSRMTSSAMSVECHLTFVRGKNVRCTDECEQGGDPGSAHNDTDRANHRWLLSSTLRGRRHDSPTRRARDRPRAAAWQRAQFRPVSRKRADLQDGCSQCPRTLCGWEDDHVQLRFPADRIEFTGYADLRRSQE